MRNSRLKICVSKYPRQNNGVLEIGNWRVLRFFTPRSSPLFYGFGFLILLLLATHCRPIGEHDRTVDPNKGRELPISQDSRDEKRNVSFAAFLAYFQDDLPLESWPDGAQRPLVLENDFWYMDSIHLERVLKQTFRKLPEGALHFIPTEKIEQPDEYSEVIKEPYLSFDFYAYAKLKRGSYWLVSIFARKKEREDQYYHVHPFFLVTYSESGHDLDSFIWWRIIDDDIQTCGSGAGAKDTLYIGGKFRMENDTLSEIFQKTVITPKGKFKTVFSNYPKSNF